MRINEFNTFTNLFKNLSGAASSAAEPNKGGIGGALLRKGKTGLSTEDQLAMDDFVEKFVSRGANSLNTAISQGLVDPASTELGGSGGAQPDAQAQPDPNQAGAAPAAGGQPAAPAAGGQPAAAPAAGGQPAAAPAAGGQPAAPGVKKPKAPGDAAIPSGQKQGAAKPEIDANVDKAVSAMRSLQPAGTKPLPQKMADELNKTLQNVRYNKDYLLLAADKINKFNGLGYDVKDFHKNFMAQHAIGKKQKTISESRLQEIYKRLTSVERFRNALKKAGYDPDLAVKRIEKLLAQQKKERENRDRYLKTDEGIMDKIKGVFGKKPAAPAAGGQPAAPGAPTAPAGEGKPSIGAWFRDNFMKNFFKGMDISSAQGQIDAILKRMPQSYKAGTLNKDLTDIANIAWAVSDQGKSQDK